MSLKIAGEVKIASDPCVLAWDNKLYVGTEDGSLKSFQDDLKEELNSWSAHAVQVFALAAADGHVYSASNDGGVKSWSPAGELKATLPVSEGDTTVLRLYGNELYAGDEVGNLLLQVDCTSTYLLHKRTLITVYENDKLKAKYNVLEEVKDLSLSAPYLFTVRDLDATVTEIKPDESKNRFMTRHTMEGSAPLRAAGARLLLMARGGNTLRLHEVSVESRFKLLHELKISDMIVTSLEINGDYAWTGGWDGRVRRFKIDDVKLTPAGELELGSCINALAATAPDTAYAALAGGRMVRVKAG
ncbi:hypothetical protein EVAR_20904_1 [Eumeta japonica]|uniref:Uncharacterized protein n=1 Tax=Eumeta variegata TaxID=151549 RepID=A0A4C1UVD3_EUMVA|nr:hypothetical protein EVAR_20904_1 [Eumeta japonica]